MISKTKLEVSITTTLLILVFAVSSSLILGVHADTINPGVFSVDSKPYGMSYGQWIAKWTQWLISIPQSSNPITDPTGVRCTENQSGPVWFLPGTNGGSAERNCTIPLGKAILFPVISSECDFASFPNVKSDGQLILCAQADVNRAVNLQANIDGVSLKQLDKYRLTSPVFNVVFLTNNIYGATAGPTQGSTDGYWVFLQPLSIGKHELHFSGLTPGNPSTGTTNFAIDVTYHLTIR
jgi:hypothetical protein